MACKSPDAWQSLCQMVYLSICVTILLSVYIRSMYMVFVYYLSVVQIGAYLCYSALRIEIPIIV